MDLSQLALKSQTVYGAIHFVLFSFSWPTIIGLLKDFLDKDRLTFNCIPKPSEVIKQLCYGDYISTVSPLLVPLDFAYITCGILGFLWVSFILYSAFARWRIQKAEKEPQQHLKKCWARQFMRNFLIHVCTQLVVLAVMLGLFCGFQTIHLPAVYKCSQRNNTQIPTNQVKMTCNDLYHSQKSKLNIGMITIMAISIVLCFLSIIHLYLTRQNFLEQLLGNKESYISIEDSGNMAGLQQLMQSEDKVDHDASDGSPPEQIPDLGKKMKNLTLGNSSVNKSGMASSTIIVRSNAEGTVNKSDTGSTTPSPPGLASPDDCILMKEFIRSLPQSVWKELIIKLDPPNIEGNYKDLAEQLGWNKEKILYFESLKNPTEAVLNSRTSTLEELCTMLVAIGRSDAKLLIKEWVKSQDCKCTACSTNLTRTY